MLISCTVTNLEHIDPGIYEPGMIPLKLNGVYHCEGSILMFFADGSSLDMGCCFDDAEFFFDHAKKWSFELYDYVLMNGGWGGFTVSNDKQIIIQTVIQTSSGSLPRILGVVELRGLLLNDSTFYIKEYNNFNQNQHLTVDRIYRFKKYYPKPDSLNWVKDRVLRKK